MTSSDHTKPKAAPSPVLPSSPEEIQRLACAPDSVTRNYASDSRLLMLAGYATILQVAHPTVGAGVETGKPNDAPGRGRK